MVPVPPSDVKANSVLLCFFPSSSQQLQDLKIQALSTKRGKNTKSCSSSPDGSCFEVKSTDSDQLYMFLLKTVSQHGEKMLQFVWKKKKKRWFVCPVLRQVSYLQSAPCPQPSNGLKSCSCVFIRRSQSWNSRPALMGKKHLNLMSIDFPYDKGYGRVFVVLPPATS